MQSSSESSSSSITSTAPSVTVITENPNDDIENWFEDNPAITLIVVIAVIITVAFVFFWWCRTRKSRGDSVGASNNNSANLTFVSSSAATTPNMGVADSFVVIGGPKISRVEFQEPETNTRNTDRQRTKSKQMLAVPPTFMVTQRKSAPSGPPQENPHKNTTIGWSRWSTAGLEVPSSSSQNSNTQSENPSAPAQQTEEQIPQPPPGYMLSVPVVYRRVSYGQNHAVYVPEPRM